ncbi:hypothetical protein M0L20_24380 [Spirosoma sp. RP8]|uniref:Uncharacterized protein n=1 Tax=Spirosoma liriopis TaxID=2937440 RepID=A0ABT0HS87_9BACT|nr:hypothetical protein [Spirosoma liriopis]MCK8495031.1 hypothetical protein [Spirosoma liriopis]
MIQVTYHISGFDRLNFVSDITSSVPQDESVFIRTLNFEADGVLANGILTIQVQQKTQPISNLAQRFYAVPGVISLSESTEQVQ